MNVMSGLDVLLQDVRQIRERRIGLIANHSAVTSDLVYAWDAFSEADVSIKRLFSPEHGLYGTEQDQIEVEGQPGSRTEVVSLYGNHPGTLKPEPGVLEDLDLILFDIQDVGTRYYTFANTMALFMEEVSGSEIEFTVLDRPNPLDGMKVEGPLLQEGYESFVGVHPVPVRHGMTVGELARHYRWAKDLDLRLNVVPMAGWHREMSFQETGLPWVPPSPNMPSERTVLVYPGLCLLEGTNLSEGRGTTTPFELVGSSFASAEEVAARLNQQGLPGIGFRPTYFRPTFHKGAHAVAGGVFLHVIDRNVFQSFLTGVAVVKVFKDLYPDRFAFRKHVYEFVEDRMAFDLLCGGVQIRESLESGSTLEEISSLWARDEEAFSEVREPFLLYS